jgi:XTP/dITP diphosphohydrolase
VYKELSKKDKNWKDKKIKARFICALSICYLDKKIASVMGKVEGYISAKPKGKMVLVMIQFLFPKIEERLLVK